MVVGTLDPIYDDACQNGCQVSVAPDGTCSDTCCHEIPTQVFHFAKVYTARLDLVKTVTLA